MNQPAGHTTRHQWQAVKEILEAALEASVGDRERLVRERCGDDEDLRREVQSLLSAHDEVAHGTDFFGVEDEPGQVGRYRIVRPIARGGMGVVYLAEQIEPIRRQVAVKLIQDGFSSREIVERFHLERQALALMNHPNIAQALDAGETESGRPFFVMEYVPGIPITDFCDDHLLDLDGRLSLFVAVCGAIQHAHQKGLIHRDIKPSNVLVVEREGEGVPKVIDFGIAKATNLQIGLPASRTRTGVLIGTPDYLSPEQAALTERHVDTRTDVYSLGVLLYEMLTGQLPFGRSADAGAPFDEILRRVRLEEPPRPSVRVGLLGGLGHEIARLRRTEVPALVRTLRLDLDWIVLRALEKDVGRRYDSASALAADITRYLSLEPVEARPPSATYRLRKYVRRHRLAAIAAAAVIVTLLVGLVGTTTAWMKAIEARRISREVTAFLTDDLLGAADPDRALGAGLTVREALDLAAVKVDKRFADEPVLEAQLRLTLGRVYASLRATEPAVANLERAIDLRRQTSGQSVETAEALEALARAIYTANPERAVELIDEVVKIRERRLGPQDDLTMRAIGDRAMYRAIASGAAAVGMDPMMMAAFAVVRGKGETSAQLTGHLEEMTLQVERLWASGRHEEARQRILDEVQPFLDNSTYAGQTPWVLSGYGMLLVDRGLENTGAALYDLSIDLSRKFNGSDHRYTLFAEGLQARLWDKQGRAAEAEPVFRRLVRVTTDARGLDNLDAMTAVHNLGLFLLKQNRPKEAEVLYRETLDVIRGKDSTAGIEAARIYYGHGAAMWKLEQKSESAPDLVKAASLYTAHAKSVHKKELTEVVGRLAGWLDELGRGQEAAALKAIIEGQGQQG